VDSYSYILKEMTLSATDKVNIEEKEFIRIRDATNCLSGALAIEESYEILISNYLDFEKELLSITCEYMIGRGSGYSNMFDARLNLNRRIVNLLTSSKLYLEHWRSHIANCISDLTQINKQVENIKSYIGNEYDNSFEYRFMENLRNHVQHAGLAIHSGEHGGFWSLTNENTKDKLEYRTAIFAHKDRLRLNKRLKQSVLNEMPDKVNLAFSSRSYVNCLSNIHERIRYILNPYILSSRDIISNNISIYTKHTNNNSIALAACKVSNTEVVEYFYLLLDWDDIRLSLVERNKNIKNLASSYVTGCAVR